MANTDHIMPRPFVVPIFWGSDYVSSSNTTEVLGQAIRDLVTGPFMSGLAQYGVQRGTVAPWVVIDEINPPAVVVYKDTQGNLQDDITKKLLGWIQEGTVPACPPDVDPVNLLYLILPSPRTTPQTFNTPSDPIGNGAQGWHNEGGTNPAQTPPLYWAIVKTNDTGAPISSTMVFVNQVILKVGHELAEQFVDRNGSFQEVGDPCNSSSFTYRGVTVQQYHSDWDTSSANMCGCINGDSGVSLRGFLSAIGFDFAHNGLRQLGVATLNTEYVAVAMQSRDSVQASIPNTCG